LTPKTPKSSGCAASLADIEAVAETLGEFAKNMAAYAFAPTVST
jgi:hypothetical protein